MIDEKGMGFVKELTNLINHYGLENASDTPDYILARYLYEQLKTFDSITLERDKWWGHTHWGDNEITTNADS